MFKALIKTRLMSGLFSLSRGKRGNKGKKVTSLAGTLALFLLVFVLLSFSFSTIFIQFFKPLNEKGLVWLYFAFSFIFTLLLSVIGTVFMTQSQLYEAKDNDLLLSMPILPKYILASRMLSLYIYNLAYVLIIAAPVGIVWGIQGDFNVTSLIFYIVSVILTPFISLTISCLFGLLITFVTSKVKNKTIITYAFTLVFIALYMYFYFSINKIITSIIINAESVAGKLEAIPPLYHFGKAIADGDIISLIITAATAIIPFAILYVILSKSFINLATAKRGNVKIKYKERALKVGSATGALIRKERTLFFKTPIYVINSYVGSVLIIIGCVALLIKLTLIKELISAYFTAFEGFIPSAFLAVICYLQGMNTVSSPSVSLEGKSLWIPQSIPVTAGQVLCSKAYNHILVTLPSALLASATSLIAFKQSPIDIINTILTPIVITVFFGFLGVVINLKFPNFNWISPTDAIKKSISVLIYMLLTIVILLVPLMSYIFLLSDVFKPDVFLLMYTILLSALTYMLYYYLNNSGAKRFERLSS